MATYPMRLDLLPVEIIQHIASFSRCEDVLKLFEVNRSLHNACNDHFIFKAIINNKNGYKSLHLPWNCDFLSGETSASICAAFALADSKAWQWPEVCSILSNFCIGRQTERERELGFHKVGKLRTNTVISSDLMWRTKF
jgi:hypothetical protein